MTKLLVVREDDPGIAVTVTEVQPGVPGRAQGFYGCCTECGPDWVMHRWNKESALASAQFHVDVVHDLSD